VPRGRLVAGVEFVQMPAQPVDHPGSLGHEVVAVIAEQADITCRAIELSSG
jgi:hypothetical protein